MRTWLSCSSLTAALGTCVLIGVDFAILLQVILEKFWRRCLILLSCLSLCILLPKPLPCPFLLHWHMHGPQVPARPQHFSGCSGFLTSTGLFQSRLFCDYVFLCARRALSETGRLVTHKGRLTTPSLQAWCPGHGQGCCHRCHRGAWQPPTCLPSHWRQDHSITSHFCPLLCKSPCPDIPPTADGHAPCSCTHRYTICLPEYVYVHTCTYVCT